MDWSIVFSAGAFALSLAVAIGGLVFLIIKLKVDPLQDAIRQIQATLHPMEVKLKTEAELQRMTDLAIAKHAAECRDAAFRRLRPSVTPGQLAVAFIIAILLAVLFLACGCASITPTYSPEGRIISITTAKVPLGPDIEYEEEFTFDPTGKILIGHRIRYSTHTTADRVAALVAALFEGWNKLKP